MSSIHEKTTKSQNFKGPHTAILTKKWICWTLSFMVRFFEIYYFQDIL